MTPTKLLYMEDMQALNADALVVATLQRDGKDIILLDQTILYAQGGGQPYDTGYITSAHGKFRVEQVRYIDGDVRHIGTFENGSFSIGETVHCAVDVERRKLHARLHSAGHIVDMAVESLGLQWIPGKGYHFPDGPYVEYTGSLGDADREKLKADIEAAANKFIAEGRTTTIKFMSKDEMKSVCHFVPENLPEGKPMRVVLYGNFGVPCGGTHVANISEVQHMTIRKVKQEGANIRVGYDVSR